MTVPIVFITGASSGLGQALAGRFYQAGYQLALVARRVDAVHDWAKREQLDAARFCVYRADVADVQSIVDAGRACIAQQGLPDVVIANAGISIGMDSAIRDDLDVLAQTFATNNIGLAATFHPFIDGMVQRMSGTLVGIASVAGIRGLPGHGAYCASKAAVIRYCESLRGEMRAKRDRRSDKEGVRVVTIAPGYVATPLTQKNRYAMPFLMQPQDFAEQAFKAIVRGKSYQVIPWQMALVAKLLALLPNALFDRVLAGRPRKSRREVSATPDNPA